MTVHLQADTSVVNDLLSRFPFTSYNSIVQARVELAQQIRLTMQHPQTYQTPPTQHLPPAMGREATAQYVHPWNIACALMNVCVNGARFGGDNLAPQEDLQIYDGQGWRPLMGCTFPSAVVPMQEAPKPDPAPAPMPEPPQANPVAQQMIAEADAEATTAILPSTEAQLPLTGEWVDGNAPVRNAVTELDGSATDLPDSNIALERTGQSGRPQKSPFEKKIEERSKVAPPPFWWAHVLVSAPKIFTSSPAGAVDDSSTGAGPVQSFMVLNALLLRALKGVAPGTTVAQLRTYLREIDEQVAKLPHGAAANQLRDALVPKQ